MLKHGVLGLGGSRVAVIQTFGVRSFERREELVQLLLRVKRVRHHRRTLARTRLRFLLLGGGGRAVGGGIELIGVC